MALNFRNIPVAFNLGLDQKADPKATIPGSFTELVNATFVKRGVITTRNGYSILSRDIEAGGGVVSAAVSGASFNDELLVFNGTSAYSRSSANGVWIDRGAVTSVIADTNQVIRNAYTQSNPDTCYLPISDGGGIVFTAWEDSRGGVRYSARDAVTGAIHAYDVSVSSTGSKPKLVVFDNQVVLFYTKTNDATKLFYRRILPSTPGTLGTETNPISSLAAANHYDVTVIAERLFIFTNEAVAKLRYLDTAFTLSASVSPMNAMAGGVGMWTDASENIWMAGATATEVYVAVYNYATVSSLAFTLLETISGVTHITGYVPTGASTATVLYDVPNATTYNTYIRKNTMTLAGVAGTASDFLRSVGLSSKAFVYGSYAYVGVSFESTLQSTQFVVNQNGLVVARVNSTNAGPLRSKSTLSEFGQFTTGKYIAASTQKGSLSVSSGVLYAPIGICTLELNFTHEGKYASATVGKNLLTAGGVLQAYDGVSYTEHGFHVFPESLANDVTAVFSLVVTQQGSAAPLPEITQFTCCRGSRIKSGQYFIIFSAANATQYYFWFDVDGAGGDPAATGTGVRVSVNNYDTASDVATALGVAFNNVSMDFMKVVAGQLVTVTTTGTGVTTDASIPAAPAGVSTGSVATSSSGYQYKAVYEWPDFYGQIHRSAPSQALSVAVAGGPKMVSVSVPTCRLTAKNGTTRSNARIALYRTTDGGLLFYRVSSTTLPFNSTTRDLVYFSDTTSDASLVGNELLYTNGDVLDHISPDSSSMIVSYRGRAMLAGLPDKNKIAYSNVATEDDPASFNDALTITADPIGGPIVALAVMDDKLIIFKRRSIHYISGDGPNNLGTQDDFQDPILVNSDVGCSQMRSVVFTSQGLFFMSDKGYMLLDRGLGVTYVGSPVEGYNSNTITGASIVPNSTQLRTVSNNNAGSVMYDYNVGLWSAFSAHAGVWCGVWQNSFVFIRSDGSVLKDDPTSFADGDAPINLKAVTGDLCMAGLAGQMNVRNVMIYGAYRGNHKLFIGYAPDSISSYPQTALYDAYTALGGSYYGSSATYGSESPYGGAFQQELLRMSVGAGLRKCTSFRLSIETTHTVPSEGLAISGITAEVGIERGPARVPAARKF